MDKFLNESPNKGLLIALIMSTCLTFFAISAFVYYLLIFISKKRIKQYSTFMLNNRILILLFSAFAVEGIIIVIAYLYGFNIISSAVSKGGMIGFIVASFAVVFIAIIYIVFWLHYIGMAIDKTALRFIGEFILLERITSIKYDDEQQLYILHYQQGASGKINRKLKFIESTQAGQFIKEYLYDEAEDEATEVKTEQQKTEKAEKIASSVSKPTATEVKKTEPSAKKATKTEPKKVTELKAAKPSK